MKKVIITGFNGFVGKHACKEFRDRGYTIHGVSYGSIDEASRRLVDTVSICDLADPAKVDYLAIDPETDVVLNLAGFATNTGGDAELIRHINVGVHVNMCRRLGSLGIKPTYIGVSSSTVYFADQQLPLTENSVLKNATEARPYEASKIEAEDALREFDNVIIARPFNHIGAGQGPGFLVPDLALQALASLKNGTPMLVGNLKSKRDYTYVGDVVRAYADLAQLQDITPGEVYNICSSRSISGEDILAMLLSAMEIDKDLEVVVDESKLRGAHDVDDNYGSYQKLHAATGWNPTPNGVATALKLFADDLLARNI